MSQSKNPDSNSVNSPSVGAYRSIPCADYSEYELAIMHRERLHLAWVEGNVVYDRVVAPLDLETRAGAEYLICRDEQGTQRRIRLDHIRRRRPGRAQ